MNKTQETNTTTITKEWKGNMADFRENSDTKITIECPIFIIFAEYLGYVSKFTKLCEGWCNGDVPEVHMQKFLMVEASAIFHQMKKDYGMDKICDYYDRYYPLVLEEYCDKLDSIIENK